MNKRIYLMLWVCLLSACSVAYADGGYDAVAGGSGAGLSAKTVPSTHKAGKHKKKKKHSLALPESGKKDVLS